MRPKKIMIFAVGRLNPPTAGHELLIEKVRDIASGENAPFMIIPTKSFDAEKNPVPFDEKIKFIRAGLPVGVEASNIETDPKITNPFTAIETLFLEYDKLVMVVGSDRVAWFEKFMFPFMKKEFPDKELVISSAGHRDPDADGVAGLSGSKMRAAASANDFLTFKLGCMTNLSARDCQSLFNTTREGLAI